MHFVACADPMGGWKWIIGLLSHSRFSILGLGDKGQG